MGDEAGTMIETAEKHSVSWRRTTGFTHAYIVVYIHFGEIVEATVLDVVLSLAV